MKDILKDLGGWPLVTGVENPHQPVDLLKRIMKYGLLNFVNIGIGVNPKNPDQRILKVTLNIVLIFIRFLFKYNLYLLYFRFNNQTVSHMITSSWMDLSRPIRAI